MKVLANMPTRKMNLHKDPQGDWLIQGSSCTIWLTAPPKNNIYILDRTDVTAHTGGDGVDEGAAQCDELEMGLNHILQ